MTLLASCVGFAAITAALQYLALPAAVLFAAVLLVLIVALLLIPRRRVPAAAARVPAWDLPVRMLVATAFVLILTGLASALGPRLTGLLAPFPLYATVLTVFAHRSHGPGAAIDVLRGLLFGLFAFATFFLVLSTLLVRGGLPFAFAPALAGALAVQGVTLLVLRRRPHPGPSTSTSPNA
ncbi:MAG TPA: hypothetical protein VFB58_05750 [Chloroflexota bacterium]|nr:hypothetical protein [Chloroflexota bacterium]